MDDEVVIANHGLLPGGYSSMQVQPGDTITVEQLLTGMLVVSGSEAALALARTLVSQLSSSDDPAVAISAFVDAMNWKAADLGLADTQFANPDGMDDPDAWVRAQSRCRGSGSTQQP